MNKRIGLWLGACLIAGLSVGMVSAQTAQPTGTNRAVGSASKVSMNKVKLLMGQANEALLKGDEARADELLAEVVEIARQAWELGDAATSEAIFRQVLNLKSDNADALLGLAELYRRTNPIWAVEYYTRYKAINPSDPAVYYGRGTCYLARDAYALAIEDLKYLVERLEPDHVGGLTNLSLAYRGRAVEKNYDPDLFEQSVGYMKQAVSAATASSDPEIQRMIPELRYRLGRLSFEYQQILAKAQTRKANFDEAIDSLRESIREATELWKKNLNDTAMLNQMLLSYDALSEIYNARVALNPNDSESYIALAEITSSRAIVVVRQSQIASLEFVGKAVEIDPGVAKNWIMLADLYAQLGAVNAAVSALDKAIGLEPENATYKTARAKLVASTQPTTQPTTQE